MKNNQLTFILVVVFLLSTLAAALLGQKYNTAFREMQDVSATYERMQNTKLFMDQLATDTVEYSKKNPDIVPLLQALTNGVPSASATRPQVK